jgi:hypothetical protein
MKTKITIPKEVKYISEILDIFPKGLLNKGRTAAGATTIALTNSLPTIIAVPFVSLIENKNRNNTIIFLGNLWTCRLRYRELSIVCNNS